VRIKGCILAAYWGDTILNQFLATNTDQKSLYIHDCPLETADCPFGTNLKELIIERPRTSHEIPEIVGILNPRHLIFRNVKLSRHQIFVENSALRCTRLTYFKLTMLFSTPRRSVQRLTELHVSLRVILQYFIVSNRKITLAIDSWEIFTDRDALVEFLVPFHANLTLMCLARPAFGFCLSWVKFLGESDQVVVRDFHR